MLQLYGLRIEAKPTLFSFSSSSSSSSPKSCDLPNNCKIHTLGRLINFQANELYFGGTNKGVRCNVDGEFEFRFNRSGMNVVSFIDRCKTLANTILNLIELKWPTREPASILGKRFNIPDLVGYLKWLNSTDPILRLVGLNGFELDLFNDGVELPKSTTGRNRPISVECVGCDFVFYRTGDDDQSGNRGRRRIADSCHDIRSQPRSILQV